MIPLEEQIISFETSQNLEGLKTETWRAVVNKFKGSHICIWYNNSLLWNLKSVQEIYYDINWWITVIYNNFSRFKKWAVPEWYL